MFQKHQLVRNIKKNIDVSIVEVFPNNVAICEWEKDGHKHVAATSTDTLEKITDRKKIILILNRNPSFIKGIEDPDEEMQLIAVNHSAKLIQYIKSPTLETQLTAIRYDCRTLKFIENPSTEVVIAAMSYGEDCLSLVKNPSEKLIIAVVKHYSIKVIAYINEIPINVQRKLVELNADSIKYIRNASKEIIELTRKKRLKLKQKHD